MENIKIPQAVRKIVDVLEKSGHKAYIVGGCIRDSILKRSVNDWDICTSAHPDETMRIFEAIHGFKTIEVGIEHGTVMLVYEGDSYEVTTFRIDGEYKDSRRPSSVHFTRSIMEDLSRRDFTMNAMAYNEAEGIVDPFGGRSDIERRIIRCVGSPPERFKEDALRMLRAVRFASQLGFDIEKDTLNAINENWRLVQKVSIERIRQEFGKILLSERPSWGIRLLVDTKLMKFIVPEIYDMVGFDQKNPYHDKDVFEHTMHVVDSTPARLSIRLAALFHDIAKPQCMFLDENGMGHFYEHDCVGSEIARDVLKRLKYDNKTINAVTTLIREHMINLEHFTEKGIKRFIKRIGIENVEDFFELRRADIKGCAGPFNFEALEWFMRKVHYVIEKKEPLSVKELAIGGRELLDMGYVQGPRIGEVLEWLLEKVFEDPSLNEKGVLIEMARERLEESER